MATLNDIPILYYNCTGRNDFMVVIFTKNEDTNAIDTPFVAWHTLKAQSSASFVFPVTVQVGAYWSIDNIMDYSAMCECLEGDCKEKDSVTYQAGPFDAVPGTTFRMKMPFTDSSPTMEQGTHAHSYNTV